MTPLYIQLKNRLLQAITDKTYGPGAKIPTEVQLSEQFGVSRITVRQAVQELCEEGYLVKRQGKGTFVQQRRISRKLENMMSFSQSCRANDMVPSAQVLECAPMDLPEDVKRLFPGEDGRFLKVCRLRMADGVPVMLEVNFFPMPEYGFLQNENVSDSLYRILDKRGIRIHAYRNVTLDVILADRHMAQMMQIGVGTPLFHMVEKAFDKDEKLVHLGIEYVVAEHYHYSLTDHIVKEEEYDGL